VSAHRLEEELGEILQALAQSGFLMPQSERRVFQAVGHLGAHLRRLGIDELEATTAEAAERFVSMPTPGGTPSAATMHFRRSVVRLAFAAARRLGIAAREPTLDLWLPPRSSAQARPLTDEEIALCRQSAVSLGPSRHAAALALAEATARTSELALVSRSHLDLKRGTVWIAGSSRTDPRWGPLTPWGIQQLRGRLQRASEDGDFALISKGSDSAESQQASSCIALSQIFYACGLRREPDVRPVSVPAWAGASAFARGESIQSVARLLGVRSLDQAARLIGWAWDQPAEAAAR
jgi:integrase